MNMVRKRIPIQRNIKN